MNLLTTRDSRNPARTHLINKATPQIAPRGGLYHLKRRNHRVRFVTALARVIENPVAEEMRERPVRILPGGQTHGLKAGKEKNVWKEMREGPPV